MTRSRFIVLTIGAVLAATPAFAQAPSSGSAGGSEPGALPAGAIGGTITGGLPERAESTTAVGRTKPPGATVGNELGTRPDLERKSREIDRRIDEGICTGCR